MDKASFQQSAQIAIREGKTARQILAQAQANNFIDGNAHFDPRTLPRLGGAGMAMFLQAVRERGVVFDRPSTLARNAQPKTPSTSVAMPPGWASQRIAEPHWGLRAIARGTLTGLGLIVVGTACLIFFNY